MNDLIKALVDQGVTGIFAAIFVFMFWKFLNKYITNTEEQSKILAINSEILKQNNDRLEKNEKVLERVEVLLRAKQ